MASFPVPSLTPLWKRHRRGPEVLCSFSYLTMYLLTLSSHTLPPTCSQ